MRTTSFLHAWVLVLGLASAGCGGPEFPRRDCATVIWAEPGSGGDIRVEGSWDGWAEAKPLEQRDDGWFLLPLNLSPGEYGYRMVQGGKRSLDRLNPLTTWKGEEEVSLAMAESCGAPEIRVDAVDVSGDEVTVSGVFLAAPEGSALDPASLRAEHRGGGEILPWNAQAADGRFTFVARGLGRGKHTFTLRGADESGAEASPKIAVAWIDPTQNAWNEGLLYHLMIDRFRGDGGAPLAPLPPDKSGSRAGGTLDGVRAEIERGTFDELGVTALWISPVYTNPIEIREGRGDGRPYEGYHGYWPLESRGVEPRIGGEDALRTMVDEAHRHGIRVIFDLVPNHVYEHNERYLANRNKGWFNDGLDKCVCGSPGCGWSEKLSTCWFTSYMPDVRFEHPDSMRAEVDDAIFWMKEFDADGVRIDAVPMMPRAATRRITHAFGRLAAGKDALFSIGEVFTGPGAAGIESIRYFLGPHTLSGAFDFPLMWKLREVFGLDRGSLSELEDVLVSTDAAIEGSGAVLGRMLDNHDTSRFVSEVTGDGANDPWYDKPAQPTDPIVYARAKMALAFILTLHGLPVLYYGDELALAGAGDPDSRRVMPDPAAIGPLQSEVRDLVRRLGQLRRCSLALRTGTRRPIVATKDEYAYLRDAGDGDPVLVFFARKTALVSVPTGAVPLGSYVDVLSGETIEITAGGAVPLEAHSFRVLVRAGSPCRNPSP
ncbi:alpha-amylase family glycosyl hydrolase [Polyangium mundeleinium]|uniref:Alpha-amylase family glycosyl hydrolase n=1 Tax=Polyangium mundeleinium TaxID=2995306 RepID=A0ABT5F704_9BACT|nr:alpha-amylase family glycosyl hydrolase [Polyangium mundeleinium]MDC0749409.1 alpha-amylase family glycosyl hydrolase [Polyangium mundeleinium]